MLTDRDTIRKTGSGGSESGDINQDTGRILHTLKL